MEKEKNIMKIKGFNPASVKDNFIKGNKKPC